MKKLKDFWRQSLDGWKSFDVLYHCLIRAFWSAGYRFESETDTEVIAKLVHHIYSQHPAYSFRELIEQVVQQLVSFLHSQIKLDFMPQRVKRRRSLIWNVGTKCLNISNIFFFIYFKNWVSTPMEVPLRRFYFVANRIAHPLASMGEYE